MIEQETKKKKGQSNSLIPGEDDPIIESEINLNQKRTRFSLSHDQDSIGRTIFVIYPVEEECFVFNFFFSLYLRINI